MPRPISATVSVSALAHNLATVRHHLEQTAAAASGLGLMGPACPRTAIPKLRLLAHSDERQVQAAAARAAAVCGR